MSAYRAGAADGVARAPESLLLAYRLFWESVYGNEYRLEKRSVPARVGETSTGTKLCRLNMASPIKRPAIGRAVLVRDLAETELLATPSRRESNKHCRFPLSVSAVSGCVPV